MVKKPGFSRVQWQVILWAEVAVATAVTLAGGYVLVRNIIVAAGGK